MKANKKLAKTIDKILDASKIHPIRGMSKFEFSILGGDLCVGEKDERQILLKLYGDGCIEPTCDHIFPCESGPTGHPDFADGEVAEEYILSAPEVGLKIHLWKLRAKLARYSIKNIFDTEINNRFWVFTNPLYLIFLVILVLWQLIKSLAIDSIAIMLRK